MHNFHNVMLKLFHTLSFAIIHFLKCVPFMHSRLKIVVPRLNRVYYTYGSTYSRNGSYVPYMQYKMFTFIKLQ